jgi:hypothetical protein
LDLNQFPENDFPLELFDVLLPTFPSATVILEFCSKIEENNVENFIVLVDFLFYENFTISLLAYLEFL